MRSPLRGGLAMALALACAGGCSSESPPSQGTLSVRFPSTAAAVATDYLQFFVFDAPASSADRSTVCQDLMQARRKGTAPVAASQSAPIHVCAALDGSVPVAVPYGEHPVLVVGLRANKDFLIGCTLQTYGEGDAALPVSLSLIDVSAALPSKTCPTLSDFCNEVCKPN